MFGCLYSNIISRTIGYTVTAANMTASTTTSNVVCTSTKSPIMMMMIIIIMKVNFTLEQTTKAQTGRSIAVLFL